MFLYLGLTFAQSCINCGEIPPRYINGIEKIILLQAENLQAEVQNRFKDYLSDSLTYMGLQVDFLLAKKENLVFNGSGFSCFACSLPPAILDSEVNSISITASDTFQGLPAGQELRDLFIVDPINNYFDLYMLRSISSFEEETFQRNPDQVTFLLNSEIESSFDGSFTISFTSDGKQYSQTSDQYRIEPKGQ